MSFDVFFDCAVFFDFPDFFDLADFADFAFFGPLDFLTPPKRDFSAERLLVFFKEQPQLFLVGAILVNDTSVNKIICAQNSIKN